MVDKKPFKVHEKDTKPRRKCQFSVRISSKKLVEDFKRFVSNRWNGHTYCYVGLELEWAMKKHLRDNKVEGYVDQDPDVLYGSSVAHTKLKSPDYYLTDYLGLNYCEGDQIDYENIANVMRRELDLSDPRTHHDHVNKLEASKILIRVDEDRYKTYYYKKAPDRGIAHLKRDNPLKNRNYALLVKNNLQGKTISRATFERITHLKSEDAEFAIRELEILNLAKMISMGNWYIVDIDENPSETVSSRPQTEICDCDNHLSQLCNAKDPKESS